MAGLNKKERRRGGDMNTSSPTFSSIESSLNLSNCGESSGVLESLSASSMDRYSTRDERVVRPLSDEVSAPADPDGMRGGKAPRNRRKHVPICAVLVVLLVASRVESRLADRSRVVTQRVANGRYARHRDNGKPIEGAGYRGSSRWKEEPNAWVRPNESNQKQEIPVRKSAPIIPHKMETKPTGDPQLLLRGSSSQSVNRYEDPDQFSRDLSSQLTGCCNTYNNYQAVNMCSYYGHDCESGETPSHDSEDEDCSQQGLSFIGISFSVNTGNGNPYSYQLCDQFPMENIIDRNYDYVMSMDEDGWLVGGGYKSFDYSGKMPYIDSSHTELLRVGSLDPDKGGTSINTVYKAFGEIEFPPFAIFPEYLKSGGGGNSGDGDGVPSADVTLIVSIVETYENDDSYSTYEAFLDSLFSALEDVGGGPCMDDHDTDPHVSMARGVKFKSSYHAQQYMYEANLEVAVWQAMYPTGVPIGTSGSAAFPPGRSVQKQKQYIGYGSLYFFFDRANITQAFAPSRSLTDDETYYATLYSSGDASSYYSSVTDINFDYGGSGDDSEWEHNPYSWKATMAMHDMTDGWELPPNCKQEGETFFGIPLSRKSDSNLQGTSTFQSQFDFESLIDRNYTYISSFGTNHGWLIGEQIGNGAGSIVDKDTAHIPLFYMGTTNPDMGGMSLSDMIKVAKHIDFGKLYIKPAFVFVDDDGHLKLQFEADASSALGYLYDNLCKELGITWNYQTPSNSYGTYTNCAMHASGDRAKYGCGPENSNAGGFCPQMTIAYSVRFQSEEHAAAYLDQCNNYVDYWRSLYPSGVAVGTNKFCADGGCLALFLNRYDVYNVFKPDLGGSWVEYNGASLAPTFSPAPTWNGGCDDIHNTHLDKCFRLKYKPNASVVAWDALGSIGKFSILLVTFMACTLSVSIFLARARKRRKKGESYVAFFIRDVSRRNSKLKKRLKRKKGKGALRDDLLGDDRRSRSRSKGASSRSRSKSKSGRSRSKSVKSKTSKKSSSKNDLPPSSAKRGRSASKSRPSSRPPSSRPSSVSNRTANPVPIVPTPVDDASSAIDLEQRQLV